MTNRRVGCILILVVMVGMIVTYEVVLPLTNPLRRSNKAVAASLLNETPIGSTWAEVRVYVDGKGWPCGGTHSVHEIPGVPGNIERDVGTYSDYILFRIEVFAYWEFDADGRLQRIEVHKFCLNML
jgi:hypothetical protein